MRLGKYLSSLTKPELDAGSFKDYVSIYDDDYNEYSAIFNLEVQ